MLREEVLSKWENCKNEMHFRLGEMMNIMGILTMAPFDKIWPEVKREVSKLVERNRKLRDSCGHNKTKLDYQKKELTCVGCQKKINFTEVTD